MLVQIKAQPWGVLVSAAYPFAPVRLATGKLVTLTHLDDTPATVYAGNDTGGATIAPVDFKSGDDGCLPGWVEEDTYKYTEPDGDVDYVEAVSGRGIAGDVTQGDIDAVASRVGVLESRTVEAGNIGSAYTLNLASDDNVWLNGVLNANATITLTGVTAGAIATLRLAQDGTGGHTLALTHGTTAPVTIPSAPGAQMMVRVYSLNGTDLDVEVVVGGGLEATLGEIGALDTRLDSAESGVYYIDAYRTALDTDDTACIFNAEAAARAAFGGIVDLGQGDLSISSLVTFGYGVGARGRGWIQDTPSHSATRILCTDSTSGFRFIGQGGPETCDFIIDGQDTATLPLWIGGLTGGISGGYRSYANIYVHNSAQDGIFVEREQNSRFRGVHSGFNARHSLWMDNSTGGHLFEGCNFFSSVAGYELYCTQTGSTTGGYNGPTHCVFKHCLFERNVALGVVYIAKGNMIHFDDCVFHSSATGGVQVELGAAIAGQVTFANPIFSVTTGQTAIQVGSGSSVSVQGIVDIQGAGYGLHSTGGAQIYDRGIWFTSGGALQLNPSMATGVYFGQSNRDSARVYHNANQSVANAANVALALNSERYDAGGWHDTATNNSRVTVVTPGKYSVSGGVEYAANATGERAVYIRRNGSAFVAAQEVSAAAAGSRALHVSTTCKLEVGDYVELVAYQTSGGALNVLSSAEYSPELEVIRVGE